MAFDPITAIFGVADKVLGAVLPDKQAKDAASAELVRMAAAGEIASIAGQLEVNKTEAAHQSWFVAGWRPFVGWTCGAALFSDFIVRPFFIWIASLYGKAVQYPPLDLSTLMTLLLGMLGLGVMRSVDKAKGVSSGS